MKNLRYYRIKRNISNSELAYKVGISTAFLSQLESGARSCSIRTAVKIAAILNVSLDDLILN